MKKTYLQVGTARGLNIKVIVDDFDVRYEGTAENAPSEVKRLVYSEIKVGDPTIYYVYSENNT